MVQVTKLRIWAREIGQWFALRLRRPEYGDGYRRPRSSIRWAYVFGSSAVVLLLFEFVTGLGLGLFYSPSADKAWQSLLYLNYQQPFGWYLRALHFWGSNFLILLLILHLIQVFVLGSYKYPRELTWISGVLLLLLTLGMALTGEVLRFDQESYWDLIIGFTLAGRTPVIGPFLVHFLMGGPIIAGATLTRMFVMHVMLLAYRLGIAEWPMPGRIVKRETYLADYRATLDREGEPRIPNRLGKDLVF